MLTIIEEQREALERLCEEYAVSRLELFGSATGARFDPARSDLDFLVAFRPHPTLNAFVQYFDFKDALERLFGRPVDLVMIDALRNRYFIQGVNESRTLLYAA